MNKKLFLYELKAYLKPTAAVAIFSLVAALGHDVAVLCFSSGSAALDPFESIQWIFELSLYALTAFLVVFSIYRTAAYDKLYTKVNQNPIAVLGTRMLCLSMCVAGTTLFMLLVGTLSDLLFEARHPVYYTAVERFSYLFTLRGRNPFYFLFSLSMAMSALVVYSCGAAVCAAVRSAENPVAKLFVGLFWSAFLAFVLIMVLETSVYRTDLPTLGLTEFYNYPLPRNFWNYNTRETVAPSCIVAWDVCNIAELAFGLLFVLFALAATVFFRRKEV